MIISKRAISGFLVYLFLFYIFLGPSPFVVAGVAENSNIEGGQDLFRQLFLVFIFISLFLIYKIPDNISDFNIYIIFVSYALLSVFWSDFPLHSLRRVALLFIIVSICIFVVIDSKGSLFLRILNVLTIIQCLNISYMLFFPDFSFTDLGFKGVHIQKNTLGVVCVLSILLSVICYENISKWRVLVIAGVSIFLLFMSESKTNVILLSVVFIVYLSCVVLYKYYSNIISYVFMVFASVFAIVGVAPIYFISNYAEYIEHDFLTGRGTIWLVLLDNIEDRPYFGFGYGGFWGVGESSAVFLSEASWLDKIGEGHNGFLDLIVNLGVFGLFLYLLIIVISVARFNRTESGKYSISILVLYLYLFLHNFTESSLVNVTQMVWVFFILMSIYFLKKPERIA